MGKGIANGFPCGGILIAPEFQPRKGMLGTTFGGNYLACACALAVLDIIENEGLIANALACGDYLVDGLQKIAGRAVMPDPIRHPSIKQVRGRGLMIGIEFNGPVEDLRRRLLFEDYIFTGVSGKTIIRLLPPLCLSRKDCDRFLSSLDSSLRSE